MRGIFETLKLDRLGDLETRTGPFCLLHLSYDVAVKCTHLEHKNQTTNPEMPIEIHNDLTSQNCTKPQPQLESSHFYFHNDLESNVILSSNRERRFEWAI